MPDGEQVVSKSSCTANDTSSPVVSLFTTMRYLAEVCLVILAFVSYASLQKGTLKIQLQPLPVPFLFTNSSVNDFYYGDISTPFSAVITSDVSLVMYYAPWDFDSQLTRSALERIAQKYRGQVYVAALNCWVQNGDCHQNFPKIRSFPLLLGYVSGNKGIQFRGPLQYTYIERFVQNLLRPLERIETVTDLYKLLSHHNAVVTGYFNFTNSRPAGFYPYYVASLRYLEYDVHRTIQFATLTNAKAANRLGINESFTSPDSFDIRLHLWNETIIFPHNGSRELDVQHLLQWIYHRSHSPVQWLSPNGHKSQLIQQYLIDPQRPSLILFTQRSDQSLSQSSMLVKEAALEYNDCTSLPRVTRLVQEIRHQREALETVRLALEKQCSIFGGGHLCHPLNSSFTTATSGIEEEAEKACWSSNQLTQTVHKSRIQGLGCSSNQSLSFYMMDATQHQNFAAQLGYSKSQFQLNPNVVFIIDPKDETHFTLNQRLTRENLNDFIGNFSERNLVRIRRSSSTAAAACSSDHICVREINADDFESVVLNDSSDVIVFYRKRNCVFCDVTGRFFLRVHQMFNKHPPSEALNWTGADLPLIQFVTIDSELNDLPWQFTVDKYPTIVFYPAFRKMESRVFPHEMELNVVNLLNFTLSQLNLRKRVMWFIHFCQNVACLQEAQRQISVQMAMIDQKIRSIQHHLLWSDSQYSFLLMDRLRSWMKERRFYRELTYAVLNSISTLFRLEGHSLYPDGIRPIEE